MRKRTLMVGVILVLAVAWCVNAYAADGSGAWHDFWNGVGGFLYNALYVIFIVFFTYFYTAVQFNPKDVAENLKKYGGFVPGIRPGVNTAEYIDTVLTRLTLWGALYLAAVCVLPSVLVSQFNAPFYFGGTALLIVVGVAMDTAQQIESHLLARNYDGLMKKSKVRGRF